MEIILLVIGLTIGLPLTYLLIITFTPILRVKKLPIETIVVRGEKPENRQDVSFIVDGDKISAWLYLPKDLKNPVPCVIMSHGFSGSKDCGLEKYALEFNKLNMAVLTYDYRHYGESEGEPRRFLSVTKQHNDLRGAIKFVRSRNEIDNKGVILWGTSAGANFGLIVASEDKDIKGVICQCGAYDNEEDTKVMMKRENIPFFLNLFQHAIRDKIRGKLGLSRHMLPAYGVPGSTCFFRSQVIYEAADRLFGVSPNFKNEVCASFLLEPHGPNILDVSTKVNCDVLIQVCEKDEIVSPKSHIRLINILGEKATLKSYPIGHFDIYHEEYYQTAINDQQEFLKKLL